MSTTPFNTIIGKDILEAAQWLQQNELVAIPTETVYGLAGNALSESAVLKIYRAKERPRFNPLILHVPDVAAIDRYVQHVSPAMQLLIQHFSPGPITFLLEKQTSIISDIVTAGSSKVAVRIPAHPLTQALLQKLNFPLVAPSANRFGYVSPVTAAHVMEGLRGRIPYILDGGNCSVGVESTIVDEEDGHIIIRRTGKISPADIARVSGKMPLLKTDAADHPVAPGMLKKHYATHTPLYLASSASMAANLDAKKVILLGWGTEKEIVQSFVLPTSICILQVMSLSVTKNIDEVAVNLFATMRNADHLGGDAICVQPFPDEGIGQAINDRLRRASQL